MIPTTIFYNAIEETAEECGLEWRWHAWNEPRRNTRRTKALKKKCPSFTGLIGNDHRYSSTTVVDHEPLLYTYSEIVAWGGDLRVTQSVT